MAQPSSFLSSLLPLSSPSTTNTTTNRRKTNEHDSAFSDGHGRHFDVGIMTKTIPKKGSKLSLTLMGTALFSMIAVMLAKGSNVSGPSLVRDGMEHGPASGLRRKILKDHLTTSLSDLDAFDHEHTERKMEVIIEITDDPDSENNGNQTETKTETQSKDGISAIPLWAQIMILLILLCFSALFSGLTLGLMSLNLTGLEIVMAGDDPKAAKYAEKIYPLRKQGNLLLCTLLLGNTFVNAVMAIFTADIFDGVLGAIISTGLILIFGEIIPQALCSRYALRIGSAAVSTVTVIKYLLYILTWPLAKALDLALGRELATTYSNAEMLELLNVHVKENVIDQEEANAMAGALTYKNIAVKDAMTAMEQTFMINVDEKLSFDLIGTIFKTGYSRIPVYEISRNNIIGLLFVKDLIFLDPEDNVPVRSFIQIFGRNVHLVWPDDTLGDVLAVLKKGKSHLAVVRDVNNQDEKQDPFYEVKGIITLEDIVERIIGDSIVDETDGFVDSKHSIRVERGETFEWARLRLLDTKIVDEMLSASEISAITAHLKTNHAESFKMLTDSQLKRLVSCTPVTTIPTATHDLDKKLPNELLYEKNVSSDKFTLILSGKVTIVVGSENFRSDISAWSVLGVNALEDNQWAPDYSAFVSDGPCRCIQIQRDAFVEASDASVFERRLSETNPSKSAPSSDIALSVASSTEAYEDCRLMPSSLDNSNGAPNRRKDVLALLFKKSEQPDSLLINEGDDSEIDVDEVRNNQDEEINFDEGDKKQTEAPKQLNGHN